jgi:hypothetical protein
VQYTDLITAAFIDISVQITPGDQIWPVEELLKFSRLIFFELKTSAAFLGNQLIFPRYIDMNNGFV